MNINIITALISGLASLGGILISNQLTLYRIEQLEKKVDKHNDIIHRTYVLETKIERLEREV